MNSIEQIDTENDTKSLISSFINLIGLAKLTKQVNFKRKSTVSLTNHDYLLADVSTFCSAFFIQS